MTNREPTALDTSRGDSSGPILKKKNLVHPHILLPAHSQLQFKNFSLSSTDTHTTPCIHVHNDGYTPFCTLKKKHEFQPALMRTMRALSIPSVVSSPSSAILLLLLGNAIYKKRAHINRGTNKKAFEKIK